MKLHERLAWIRRCPAEGSIKAILFGLCCFTNAEGECWPSQPVLAKASGISDRQARRALRVLKKLDVVTISNRDGRSSVFKVRMTPDTMSTLTGHYVRQNRSVKPAKKKQPIPAKAYDRTKASRSASPSTRAYFQVLDGGKQ